MYGSTYSLIMGKTDFLIELELNSDYDVITQQKTLNFEDDYRDLFTHEYSIRKTIELLFLFFLFFQFF